MRTSISSSGLEPGVVVVVVVGGGLPWNAVGKVASVVVVVGRELRDCCIMMTWGRRRMERKASVIMRRKTVPMMI